MGNDTVVNDLILEHALDLFQLTNKVQRKAVAELESLGKDITKKINQGTLTEYNQKRLTKLLAQINATTTLHYAQAEAVATEAVDGLAEVTAQSTVNGIDKAFTGVDIDSAMPTARVLGLLQTNVMIQGMPENKWWSKQTQDTVFRFQSSVRRGVMSGQTNQQIIRDLGDELGVSKAHVNTLVHSAVQTISNEARLATFKENDDIIKGLRWMSTLDSRTCKRCAPRDQLEWDWEYKPIGGHGVEFRHPQLHFNCRCLLSPVTKTFLELGLDVDMPKKVRASEVGPVENMNFESFLKRQGSTFQNNVLGKGRADLWRDGKITLLDLINAGGKELSLDDIKKKL